MPIIIDELVCSKRPYKRFAIQIREGGKKKTFHFGLKDGETYIDHQDEKKRAAYLARHLGNKKEFALINNLIPSPSLFSAALLWGKNTDLFDNLKDLQVAFNDNYNNKT